jgi:hypothetical protein
VICPEEPYPVDLRGPNGYEPCIHRLSYIPTPDRDRDMGLVEHLLDAQRTVNDATNKQVELKNLALNLPLMVGPNGLKGDYVLEPGAVIQPKGGVQDAKWMTPPDSGYMTALSRMRDEGIADMEEIASQRSVPAQIESGKGSATFTERDNMRRQFILAMFVDFHSERREASPRGGAGATPSRAPCRSPGATVSTTCSTSRAPTCRADERAGAAGVDRGAHARVDQPDGHELRAARLDRPAARDGRDRSRHR